MCLGCWGKSEVCARPSLEDIEARTVEYDKQSRILRNTESSDDGESSEDQPRAVSSEEGVESTLSRNEVQTLVESAETDASRSDENNTAPALPFTFSCPCAVEGCEKNWHGPCADCPQDGDGDQPCYCEEHFAHSLHDTLPKKGATTDVALTNTCECLNGCGNKFNPKVEGSFKKCLTDFCTQLLSCLCLQILCSTCYSDAHNNNSSSGGESSSSITARENKDQKKGNKRTCDVFNLIN